MGLLSHCTEPHVNRTAFLGNLYAVTSVDGPQTYQAASKILVFTYWVLQLRQQTNFVMTQQ